MRWPAKNAMLVLALAGAGAFGAWLAFERYLASASSFTDGVHVYDTHDSGAVRYAVWEAPERLPSSINTRSSESRAALSPDGRCMVFAVGERGRNAELYVAEMIGGEPVDPKPLASLNTEADETAPAFSSDALYFASDRSGGAGGLDLYRATYSAGTFGAAERLGDEINSALDDTDPAPRPGSRDLMFASNRNGGAFDLFVATRSDEGDTSVVAVSALNSERDEREPAFTSDGRTIFFASNRKHGADDFDLYRSARRGESWSAPVAIDGLNTSASERAPLPTFDDFSLYFARGTSDGEGGFDFDLWRARSIELYRMPDRPIRPADVAVLCALLLLALLVWLSKRWPRIELIYKCYLVSIVAHAAILWLAGGWYLRGVGRGRPWSTESASAGDVDADHFTLDLRSSIAARGGASRAGGDGGRAERSGFGLETALAKEFSEPVDGGEIGASPIAFAAPERDDVAPPSRGASGDALAPPASPPRSGGRVTLDDRAIVERRSGGAPALEIADVASNAGTSGGAYSAAPTIGAPSRPAGVGGDDVPDAPRGGAVIGAPVAVGAGAPARDVASLAPSSSTNAPSSSVAVAAPHESVAARSSEPSARLALDDLATSHGESGHADRTASSALEHRDVNASSGVEHGERDESGDRSASSAIAALAPKSSDLAGAGGDDNGGGSASSGRSSGAHGLLGAAPGRAATASIGLHDAEPTTKIAGIAAGSGGANGNGDLLDSLAAPGGMRGGGNGANGARGAGGNDSGGSGAGGASDGGGGGGNGALPLEKKSFARESSDTPQAPPALALATPDERPREEPPRPTKAWENTPYKNREGEEKSRALVLNGGTPETEAAVAKGLAYLARAQRDTGGWGDPNDLDDKYGSVAVGKTGLALLAFLGAGHTHASHTQYSDNAANAIAFLLALQDETSGHFGDSDAYSHGIATYALAECYALTGETALREPLERAVAHILSKQNHTRDKRFFGGWGYYYRDERTFDRWPRTSITVWQVMALESARLAGLNVPARVFDDATTFITNAEDETAGWFRYNHDPARLNSNWPTLPASTPAALFALSLVGRDVTGSEFAREREFVLTRAPTEYRRGTENEFVQRGQGNLYFWYYGTLAMFRAGGSAWERWNASMKDCLVRGQKKDGSWAPIDVYCNYARDNERDRSYSTAMCVLSLEVYYRYYLPLLKVR